MVLTQNESEKHLLVFEWDRERVLMNIFDEALKNGIVFQVQVLSCTEMYSV